MFSLLLSLDDRNELLLLFTLLLLKTQNIIPESNSTFITNITEGNLKYW